MQCPLSHVWNNYTIQIYYYGCNIFYSFSLLNFYILSYNYVLSVYLYTFLIFLIFWKCTQLYSLFLYSFIFAEKWNCFAFCLEISGWCTLDWNGKWKLLYSNTEEQSLSDFYNAGLFSRIPMLEKAYNSTVLKRIHDYYVWDILLLLTFPFVVCFYWGYMVIFQVSHFFTYFKVTYIDSTWVYFRTILCM